jgi:hypothetical protein
MIHGDDTCKLFSSRIVVKESSNLAVNENEPQAAAVPNPIQPMSRFAFVYKNQRRL